MLNIAGKDFNLLISCVTNVASIPYEKLYKRNNETLKLCNLVLKVYQPGRRIIDTPARAQKILKGETKIIKIKIIDD